MISVVRKNLEIEILKRKINRDPFLKLALNIPSFVIFLGLLSAGISFIIIPLIFIVLIRYISTLINFPNLATVITEIISAITQVINLPNLLWAGFFGALGSVVSVLTRLQEIVNTQEVIEIESKTIRWTPLFFTGLFKPFIGLVLAIIIFSAIKSGLIPLQTQPDTEIYLVITIAFIAGFSERLGQDISKDILGKIISSSERASQQKTSLNPNLKVGKG